MSLLWMNHKGGIPEKRALISLLLGFLTMIKNLPDLSDLTNTKCIFKHDHCL